MSGVVSASQLIDKDLFVAKGKKVEVFDKPDRATGKVLATIEGNSNNNRIGKVFTWINGKGKDGKPDGSIWFQLYEPYGKPNGFGAYINPGKGTLDRKSFEEQGGKTVEEEIKEKEDAEKDTWERIWDDVKGGIKKAAPYVLIFLIAKEAIGAKAKSR